MNKRLRRLCAVGSVAALAVLSAALLLGPPLLCAQEALAPAAGAAADPTRATAQVNDALKAQLASLRAVTLKGAVIAGSEGGVALLGVDQLGPVLVRPRTQFTATVAGLPLKVLVRDVTPAGVEIEAPTLSEKLFIAGTLGAWSAASAGPPGAMRHVEFREVPLATAIRMLSEQSGTNYSASAEAGKVPISVCLRNVPAQAVVEEICKSHNLWYRRDDQTGVLRILSMAEFERDLVSFREEQTDVFTLLYPNVLEVAAVIQDLYGERVSLSLGRDDITDESRDLAQRFQRFDMINQRSQGLSTLQGLNNPAGAGTTVVAGGAYGATVWSSDRGSAVAALPRPAGPEFRDLTPEQAQRVQRMAADRASTNGAAAALEAYRQQPASILVTVSRRNNMIIVRTSDLRAMEDIRALVRRLDVPTSLVLLEVKILSVNLSDGFNSVFDYQFNAVAKTGGGAAATTAGFTTGEILPPAAGSMTPGGAVLRSGDMTFQVVNEYFRLRMQLLEERGRVTTLATPLLLTANNEVSRLFLGEERPLVRNVTGQTLITDNTVATTPNTTIEFRPVGTTLLITPNINSDRTVTLRLLQEDSTINPGAATIPIVASSTGGVQNISVDVVATKSISGTFVAKDGMAVAIGGLIQESVSDERAQVPILGRIPGLGFFFRRETKVKARNEMVIMIRPHVISTPSEGEAISRNLLQGLSVHPAQPEAKGDLGTFRERSGKKDPPPPK